MRPYKSVLGVKMMQTRKKRKVAEQSYEMMLRLRRDMGRAASILELIKFREKIKQQQLKLSIEIFEKSYQTRDLSGYLCSEYTTNDSQLGSSSTEETDLFKWAGNDQQFSERQYHSVTNGGSAAISGAGVGNAFGTNALDRRGSDNGGSSRKKPQYRKRKHQSQQHDKPYHYPGAAIEPISHIMASSDEDISVVDCPDVSSSLANEARGSTSTDGSDFTEHAEEEGLYHFRRTNYSQYYKPQTKEIGNWPWTSKEESGAADPKYRYNLMSLRHQRPGCIGLARRRIGRGGRIVLDRVSTNIDDVWSNFTIYDSALTQEQQQQQVHQKQVDVKNIVVGDPFSVKSVQSDNIGSVVGDLVTHGMGRTHSLNAVNITDPATTSEVDADPNAKFVSEFLRDWLQTKPTPLSLEDGDETIDFGEPQVQYSNQTPLQIELQRLAEQPSSLMLNDYIESDSDMAFSNDNNVFTTSAFTLHDIMDDSSNLSDDSLSDAVFNFGAYNGNDKTLEKILRECEIDDLQTFNTSGNFWNCALEDLCDDMVDTVKEERDFDELATATDDSQKVGKEKPQHTRTTGYSGCSAFRISNLPNDYFFIKEYPPPPLSATDEEAVTSAFASITSAHPSALVVIADSNRNNELISTNDETTYIKFEPSVDIFDMDDQQHLILSNPTTAIASNASAKLYTTDATTAHIKIEPPEDIFEMVQEHQVSSPTNVICTEVLHATQTLTNAITMQQQQHQQQRSHKTVQQPDEGSQIWPNSTVRISRTTHETAETNTHIQPYLSRSSLNMQQRDSTGVSYYTATAKIFTDFEDLIDVKPELIEIDASNIQPTVTDAYIKTEPASGVFMTVAPITNVMNSASTTVLHHISKQTDRKARQYKQRKNPN